MNKAKLWKKRLARPNDPPSKLTPEQRKSIMTFDTANIENWPTVTSMCVRRNGVWRQIG